MTTYISKKFLNMIKKLAEKFAENRTNGYVGRKESKQKIWNHSIKLYTEIATFLYLITVTFSRNRYKFNYNHIYSRCFYYFSVKLYKRILDDLEKNQIIAVCHHYLHAAKRPEDSFTKAYVIHRDILRKLDKDKELFKYEVEKVDITGKLLDFFKDKTDIKRG